MDLDRKLKIQEIANVKDYTPTFLGKFLFMCSCNSGMILLSTQEFWVNSIESII